MPTRPSSAAEPSRSSLRANLRNRQPTSLISPRHASKWVKQDRIDHGEIPETTTTESADLWATRRRIRELETELLIVRQAAKFLGEDKPRSKRLYPVIDRLVDAGVPADRCRRVLGVARQNYYKQKRTPMTPTRLRREWLTGLIREVHVASRRTCGYRRVHAELTMGMGITVCERTVWLVMNQAGIYGLPGPTRVKRLRGVVTADDLVNLVRYRSGLDSMQSIGEVCPICPLEFSEAEE